MEKRKRRNSINIEDLPVDIIKNIIKYSPGEFLTLSKRFCNLRRSLRSEVDVSKAKKYLIDDKIIFKTIFSSYNIRKLIVNGWTKWDDKSVKYLSRLIESGYFKHLRSLEMRNCQHISNKSLQILLPTIGKNLYEIDIYNCNHVNYKVFKTYNTNLKSLLMGYSKTSDANEDNTSGVLEYFFGSNKNSTSKWNSDSKSNSDSSNSNRKSNILFPVLEKIQLYNFIGIKNLTPLLNIAKTLRHLDIRGCVSIEPSQFEIISDLTLLEHLHIGMPVDNSIILKIIRSCRKISVLDLSGSPISHEVVASLCQNLNDLTRLKLTKCNTITNEDLNLILSSLNRLDVIDVSHCWRLTNSLFDSLSLIASGPRLSKIGVYMCSLDSSKLIYKFNIAGATNVVPIIHNEVQIDI